MIETVKIQGEGYLVNGSTSAPKAEGNRHYKMVQEWISEGGVVEDEFTQAELTKQTQNNLIAHFKSLYLGVVNAKLVELDYDSLDRVAGYACRPTSIYNAESIKILDWHESIIIYNYALLKDVKDGLIQVPTDEEYLAGVPVYV